MLERKNFIICESTFVLICLLYIQLTHESTGIQSNIDTELIAITVRNSASVYALVRSRE